MKKVVLIGFAALFAVAGSAQASDLSPLEDSSSPVSGRKFSCQFEGRGGGNDQGQGHELKCRVRGLIPVAPCTSTPCPPTVLSEEENRNWPAFELECSNHWDLRSEYPVVHSNAGIWINAKDRKHFATIYWQPDPMEMDGNRKNAQLGLFNESAKSLEGKCWWEKNGSPPAPPLY